MGVDYYKILGVDKSASESELKKGEEEGAAIEASHHVEAIAKQEERCTDNALFACSLQKAGHEVPPSESCHLYGKKDFHTVHLLMPTVRLAEGIAS